MEQNNQPPVFHTPQSEAARAPQPMTRGPRPALGLVEAVKQAVARWRDYDGRSRRSELWWTVLVSWLVSQLVTTIAIYGAGYEVGMTTQLVLLAAFTAVLLPLQVRRLHDTGSGAALAYCYVVVMWATQLVSYFFARPLMPYMDNINDPAVANEVSRVVMQSMGLLGLLGLCMIAYLVVGLIILIKNCKDSDPMVNAYGPSPKYGDA